MIATLLRGDGLDEDILVVGSGQMGPQIALSFAVAGYRVVISGRTESRVDDALRRMSSAVDGMVDNDLLDDRARAAVLGRVSGEVGLGAGAKRCSYAIEAVVEDLDVKQAVFQQLEEVLSPDALLASTTSALSPTAIQRSSTHPGRFIVTHYIQPAHLMPIVEVVPGAETAPATTGRAMGVLESCGFRSVLCGDVPGFLFNRLQYAILREAVALLRDGVAGRDEIEVVLKMGYGSRLPAMGPFEHADLGGLELTHRVASIIWPDLDRSTDPSHGPLGRLIEEGRYGISAGRGFHDWAQRDAEAFQRQRDLEIIRRLKILRDEIADLDR